MVRYNPLHYLAALGSAGISVALWKLGDVTGWPLLSLQALFLLLAIALFLYQLPKWITAVRREGWLFSLPSPSKGSPHPVSATGWMAMPTAFVMILNAFSAFAPAVGISMEEMALPAFSLWLISFLFTTYLASQILLGSFSSRALIKDFHFGILLQPLAFGLHAIPGVVLSSLLPPGLSDVALVLALTAFAVGGMLGALGIIFLFLRLTQFGWPPKEVAPATLVLLPSISVYTIFLLKLFHAFPSLEVAHGWFTLITYTGWGVMLYATLLGLGMLLHYFREGIPISPAWWSFVCPFVAMSVLSSIAYSLSHINAFLWVSVAALATAVLLYIYNAVKVGPSMAGRA